MELTRSIRVTYIINIYLNMQKQKINYRIYVVLQNVDIFNQKYLKLIEEKYSLTYTTPGPSHYYKL